MNAGKSDRRFPFFHSLLMTTEDGMRNKITTDRLTLRQLRLSDAPNFTRYGGEYDIAKMTGSFPYPFPRLSAEFKIMTLRAQKRRGVAHPYTITFQDDELMGIADIFRRSETADWELGYWVARPFWGQGLAGEAMMALMIEAQQTLNADRFIAGVWDDNPNSIRVLEKLGFKATGRSQRAFCMARLEKLRSVEFVRHATVPLPERSDAAIHAG